MLSGMYMHAGATVTLVNSEFTHNTVNNDSSLIYMSPDPYWPHDNSLDPSDEMPIVLRLQNVSFTENAVSQLMKLYGSYTAAQVFSDELRAVDHASDGVFESTNSSTFDSTLPLADAPKSKPGITASSPWLLETQKVRICKIFQPVTRTFLNYFPVPLLFPLVSQRHT